MKFDSPLDDIFRNQSHVRVLRALYRLPEGLPATGRETARRAGITHPTALRTLGVLVDAGLVKANRSAAGDGYELNRDHFFAPMMADLFGAEFGTGQLLVSFIRDQLLALTDKVEWAALFGSAVWGNSTPTSDIDLAVSCNSGDGDEVERALDSLSENVRRHFGNHLNPLINTRKQRPKTGMWKRLEKDGVPIVRSGKAVPL